jgi:hypothetical protein
MRILL